MTRPLLEGRDRTGTIVNPSRPNMGLKYFLYFCVNNITEILVSSESQSDRQSIRRESSVNLILEESAGITSLGFLLTTDVTVKGYVIIYLQYSVNVAIVLSIHDKILSTLSNTKSAFVSHTLLEFYRQKVASSVSW